MPRITAVLNQKGGVGKTTVVCGLAASLAVRGQRVLVVDADPQANATTYLAPDLDVDSDEVFTLSDVLWKPRDAGSAAAAVTESAWPGVDLIPGSVDLARIDVDGTPAIEQRLRKALGADAVADYDHVLIDCPPGLARLTINALTAADQVLLVTEPANDSIRGLIRVRETVTTVQEAYNERLRIAGIVINLLEDTREKKLRVAELEESATYGPLLWKPYLPKRAPIAEARGIAVPVAQMGSARATILAEMFDQLAEQLSLSPVEA